MILTTNVHNNFNKSAILIHFLSTGEQEISPIHPQTNSTEPDNPRTWSAASVVQIPANKERHGTVLKCLALHESYSARSVAVEARLDVKCEYDGTFKVLHGSCSSIIRYSFVRLYN